MEIYSLIRANIIIFSAGCLDPQGADAPLDAPSLLPRWLSPAQSEPTRAYMALYRLSTDAEALLCTMYTVPLITIYTSGSNRPLSPAHPHPQLDDSLGNNRLQKVMAHTAAAGGRG